MENILFIWPGNDPLARQVLKYTHSVEGEFTLRKFPDGETYIRVDSDVKGKPVRVFVPLDRPDDKILALEFFCRNLKVLGASNISLIVPYLPYMRQDIMFHPGEAVTSEIFAKIISGFADELITVDPHLHRVSSLDNIYSIACRNLHTADIISDWIGKHVTQPVLIGPDEESAQWVSEIAQAAGAPFLVQKKLREGDRTVHVSVPEIENYPSHTPVLVDDIISTAATMITAIQKIREVSTVPPVCIGIHALFADDAYYQLLSAGASQIVTCNTVVHESNGIDIGSLFKSLKDH